MITVKQTNDLSPKELIDILKARTAVFVVEQNCPYQEVDNDDYTDFHVQMRTAGQLQAYTRIMNKDNYITFGRVLVVKKYRQAGLGRKIVSATIEEIKHRFPNKPIKIQAQAYLKDFYASFGFKATSDVYLEDNIPHLDMLIQIP